MDEIVGQFEKHFSKKFFVKKSDDIKDFAVFDLNSSLSIDLFAACDIDTKDYITHLLDKYYPVRSPHTTRSS
jgi:hypothetical protein